MLLILAAIWCVMHKARKLSISNGLDYIYLKGSASYYVWGTTSKMVEIAEETLYGLTFSSRRHVIIFLAYFWDLRPMYVTFQSYSEPSFTVLYVIFKYGLSLTPPSLDLLRLQTSTVNWYQTVSSIGLVFFTILFWGHTQS